MACLKSWPFSNDCSRNIMYWSCSCNKFWMYVVAFLPGVSDPGSSATILRPVSRKWVLIHFTMHWSPPSTRAKSLNIQCRSVVWGRGEDETHRKILMFGYHDKVYYTYTLEIYTCVTNCTFCFACLQHVDNTRVLHLKLYWIISAAKTRTKPSIGHT